MVKRTLAWILPGLVLVGALLAEEAVGGREEAQSLWSKVQESLQEIPRPDGSDPDARSRYYAAVAEAHAEVARAHPRSRATLQIAGSGGNSYSQLVQSGHHEYAAPLIELLQPYLDDPPEGAAPRELRTPVTALALTHGALGDLEAMDRILARGEELGVEIQGYRRQALAKYLKARPGEPAPPLAGPLAGGGAFDLASMGRRPVLIFFWSTRSQEIVEHMAPVLEAHERYAGRGLATLGVNLDEDPEGVQGPPPKMHLRMSVEEWAEATGARWQHLVHEHDGVEGRYVAGKHNPHAHAWGVWETHALFLVDGEGKVASRRPASREELFAAIEEVLEASE